MKFEVRQQRNNYNILFDYKKKESQLSMLCGSSIIDHLLLSFNIKRDFPCNCSKCMLMKYNKFQINPEPNAKKDANLLP